MTDDAQKPTGGGRPKWYVPLAFAVAFTLSFILAEVMGPVGAVVGLGIGSVLGWAGAKWIYPVDREDA
ncbi:hypothetical protein [Tropicimonas sp. S265A]|uniref:hypothetical protein n=1 Tax=Tropicimonas sp. S265A TaxID=3415134 RepID=UPI003C7AB725